MRTLIAKEWTFDAAHRLPLLPETHKCHRLHGHTYRAVLEIGGTVDDRGMIVDYDALDALWRVNVHDLIDHRYLNDVDGIGDLATTEVLAAWIYDRMVAPINQAGGFLMAARVYESAATYAEYRAFP
jgi:6-pyruvoyltetrahydropterin/6-carboxytetrahydropterin synthase